MTVRPNPHRKLKLDFEFTVGRRDDVKLVTRDRTFDCWQDAKLECGICGALIHATGHRNFRHSPDFEQPARIDGSPVDHCYFCSVKVRGLRSFGHDQNVTYRDHGHIMAASAFAQAIEREARHAR